MEKFRLAPLDEKQVFVTVIIVVTPDSAHRYTGTWLVHVSNAKLTRNVLERTVMHISVKTIVRTVGTVRDIDIGPSILIEINHGCRRAHRRNLGHDGI